MRYLFLVREPDTPDRGPDADIEDWVRRHDADGSRVLGERLRPAADVRQVRVSGGRTVVTDGPFAEAKEVIGGFDVVEAPDLAAALAIAAEHPGSWGGGTVEVHPFWPTEEAGAE
ncbi:YciI family protein [Isoptericola sp. NEAU-Y5]|uniref:YciI family protein n=1 Tax=Isoptericola luteus TaxID=2879484 RepID=A0ABS7ZCP7_9MICO|nr:YciI family protein [Isoptericola sp. NEAU-Y5]MCA5892823.1 YciI family protein [Isoptericola sp. NEAU-Y5]